MTAGWMKSLQCKAKAADDVVQSHHHLHILPPSSSCRKSFHDIVDNTKHKPKPRKNITLDHQPSRKLQNPKPKPNPNLKPKTHGPRKPETHATFDIRRPSDSYIPALTDLPEGHPSRNVVEIIFHTSWSSPKVFSGRIEMVFKVQNLPRTVTRFEEYRETVKSGSNDGNDGSREDHARCVADGNEVMRFQCLGSTSNGGGACDGAWSFQFGKGAAALCTFSGSGVAHESAGGGRGRKAMLVCRVIAGRVRKFEPVYNNNNGLLRVGYDSVSGENGELLVFDSRAVLPCFLIIYKL